MSAGGDEIPGEGEAHRDDKESELYTTDSPEFRRPWGMADPTAVYALINLTEGRRAGSGHLTHLRGKGFEVILDPALALAILQFMKTRTVISQSRSGHSLRARLAREID